MSFFKQGVKIDRTATTAMSAGITTLLNTSEPVQDFTGAGTHTLKLPAANTMAKGQAFEASNSGTGVLTIVDDGSNVLAELAAGESRIFTAVDISTANGVFDVTASSGGGGAGLSGAEAASLDSLKAGSKSETSVLLKLNPEELAGDFWRALAGSITSKSYAAAAALNGFFYSFGGYNGGNLSINERLDSTNNYWLTRANMPASRNSGAANSAEGFAYYTGGDPSTSNNYQYNDETNAWLSRTAPTSARGFPGGFSLSDRIYVFQGLAAVYTDDTSESYDNVANAWTARAKVPYVARSSRGTALEDIGYAIAGTQFAGPVANTNRYFSHLNAWSSWASLLNGTQNHAVFTANGFMYAAGGEKNPGPAYSTVVEELLPSARIWRTRANMPERTGGGGRQPTGATVDGLGLTTSGGDSSTPTANAEIYYNASFFKTAIVLRSLAAPTALSVGVSVKGLGQIKIPVMVRTDGDNWKFIQANGDALKFGEALAGKFVPGGLPYVQGGNDGVSRVSTESYNSIANLWIQRANSTHAADTSGGFKAGGLGYIFGGNNGGPYVATAQRYDEIANSWSTLLTSLPDAAYATGFSLNNVGYAVLGFNGTSVLGTAYKFVDPSWVSVTALTTPKSAPNAMTINGRTYLTHGSTTSASANVTGTSEVYSDITNSWLARATSTNARQSAAHSSLDGIGYVAGGDNGSGGLNLPEKYNPVTDAWANIAVMSTVRSSRPTMFTVESAYLQVSGGVSGSTLMTSERYNPNTNAWENRANMNLARSFAVNNFAPGPYYDYELRIGVPAFYVAGTQLAFITRANMQIARNSAVCAVLSGRNLAFGDGNTAVEVFDREQNTWRSTIPTPNGNIVSATVLLGLVYTWGGNALKHYAFNPDTGIWDTKTNSNVANRLTLSSATYRPFNGFGIIHGGGDAGGTTTFPSLEQYSPVTNAWTTKASRSNTSVNYSGAFLLGGFYTGLPGSDASRTNGSTGVDRYNDSANAWSVRTAYPVTSAYHGVSDLGKRVFTHGNANPTVANGYEYFFDQDVWRRTTDYPTATSANSGTSTGLTYGGSGPVSTTYQLTLPQKEVILGASLNVS